MLGNSSIDELRRSLRGTVALPGGPDYDDARRTFNGLTDRYPKVVVRPLDTQDVRVALAFARAHDLPVSVRGGGHSVAGHAVGEGALALDLRALAHVRVDPQRRRVRAGGGATWRDVAFDDSGCAEWHFDGQALAMANEK